MQCSDTGGGDGGAGAEFAEKVNGRVAQMAFVPCLGLTFQGDILTQIAENPISVSSVPRSPLSTLLRRLSIARLVRDAARSPSSLLHLAYSDYGLERMGGGCGQHPRAWGQGGGGQVDCGSRREMIKRGRAAGGGEARWQAVTGARGSGADAERLHRLRLPPAPDRCPGR